MPLYDFTCKCGNTTEVMQSFDAESPACEKCGKPMKRLSVPTKPPRTVMLYSPMHPRKNRGRGY